MSDKPLEYAELTVISKAEFAETLASLSTEERDVFFMRNGVGDGWLYELEEIARITTKTMAHLKEIEINIREKLGPVFLQRFFDRGVREDS